MKTLRNFAIAGTLAIAAALSSGAANAQLAARTHPAVASLEIGVPTAAESAIAPVHHYRHHGRRLCHVPFFKLVEWYGYWEARRIKHRCHRFYYSY